MHKRYTLLSNAESISPIESGNVKIILIFKLTEIREIDGDRRASFPRNSNLIFKITYRQGEVKIEYCPNDMLLYEMLKAFHQQNQETLINNLQTYRKFVKFGEKRRVWSLRLKTNGMKGCVLRRKGWLFQEVRIPKNVDIFVCDMMQ